MKPEDRNLGMDRVISRRDLLHGVGALAATSLVPGTALAKEVLAFENRMEAGYPPALSGLRGNHDGSFDVAHKLSREGRRDWGPVEGADSGVYDLVVVGAGISGLAAAHFYRQSNPDARILILDNHDDFGGHAKRNEFTIDGHTMIGYGGSQTMEEPSGYPRTVKRLLMDLGVDLDRFYSAYDGNFYKRHGLAGGVFFNREDWGVDRIVKYDLGGLRNYLEFADSDISVEDAVSQMPMSDKARRQMLRLITTTADVLADIPRDKRYDYLSGITYREFLVRHFNITEPQVFQALQELSTDAGGGIEQALAVDALFYVYLPGFRATGLPGYEGGEPYIHHFPDGNASIARLLVRRLIPDVAPGSTMEDIVSARFDYDKLDIADSAVRLRLDSTVVHAANDGAPGSAKSTSVTYVRHGQAYHVRARHCVLACYNAMIPALCPDLPQTQREALALQVKTPILYTTVALSNWRAWKNLGIGALVAPGCYHTNAMLDFPVSLGDYEFADSPDEPITIHMERFPHLPDSDLSTREHNRRGFHELLSTPFETMERSIRSQLGDMLGPGGFDPADDIAAITVNRWAKGYAYGYGDVDDPSYEDRNDERYPHVRARKPFGRIAIANSDAGASASLPSAVMQAHRAVNELN